MGTRWHVLGYIKWNQVNRLPHKTWTNPNWKLELLFSIAVLELWNELKKFSLLKIYEIQCHGHPLCDQQYANLKSPWFILPVDDCLTNFNWYISSLHHWMYYLECIMKELITQKCQLLSIGCCISICISKAHFHNTRV